MREKMLFHLAQAEMLLTWLLSKAEGLEAWERETTARDVRRHLAQAQAYRTG